MDVTKIGALMIPPQDQDPKVTIWRWLLWVAVMALIVVVGWLVYNSAKAGEIEEIKQDVSELRVEVQDVKKEGLEAQIFEKSVQVCTSAGDLRTAYNQELTRLIRSWRDVVGNQQANPPTLRSCEDLGIRN